MIQSVTIIISENRVSIPTPYSINSLDYFTSLIAQYKFYARNMLYQCGIIEPAFQVTCFRINFSTIQNLSSSCKCPSTTRRGLHEGYVVMIHLNSSPRNDLKGQEAHCQRVASSPLRKGLRPQRNYWCTYSEEACRISSGTKCRTYHTIPYHTNSRTFNEKNAYISEILVMRFVLDQCFTLLAG